ncbi:MAG: calcium-binding protein [Solirubrobacterales bacterium]
MRRVSLAVVVAVTALIAPPGSAGAVTQIGETFQPTDNCSPRTRLQSGSPGGKYAAPFAGVITSWSFQSSSAAGGSPVKLKVGRRAGGDDFAIVGESETESIPDLDALNTFPVRIPVSTGDVIGLYTAPASVFYCARPATGHVVHQGAFGEDVALGAPVPFSPVNDLQLDVSAALEPDCDKDGLGDETQDTDLSGPACPPPCKGQRATIVGTRGNDVRTGTPGRDVMVGLGGNDKLSGLAGNDIICGGPGKDKLNGGKGKDVLLGQKGRDVLKGGAGRDKLKGGAGKDKQVQ